MTTATYERIELQAARCIRSARSCVNQGNKTDARRYTVRAENLLIVLRQARLVRTAARFTSLQPTTTK